MRKIYLLTASVLLASGFAGAQNLNPQVQVTNDYKTNMGEAGKQGVEIEIPDSLTRFKTNVDYSVFATDYKGAYDFSPYEIRMVPDIRRAAPNKLFVRAGAGYAFNPVLQAVYSPIASGDLRLWLRQDFRGYAGDYKTIGDTPWYKGHDFAEKFGVAGAWHAEKFDLDFGVDYRGVFTEDYFTDCTFGSVEANAGIRAAENASVQYSARARVGFGRDTFSEIDALNHTAVVLEGSVMPEFDLPVNVVIDAFMQLDFYGGNKSSSFDYSSMFTGMLSPQALFEWEPVRLRAGVSFAPGKSGLEIFPDIHATADLFGQQVYASVTGGQYMMNYTDMKLADHWFNPTYTDDIRRSHEMVNCKLGMRGSLFSRLQYDVNGGFASMEDTPMAALLAPVEPGARPVSVINYADYNMWYVETLLAWKSEKLDVDAGLHLRHTNGPVPAGWLDLPLLTYNLKAVYNWGRRVFAGVRVDASSARESELFTTDSYFDLGLYGEYRFSNNLSFWAQASNLLNQKIALAPTHVRSGLFLSAGICLNL